ncbi:MAG: ATP-binding protein, partial [Slackia sp.]|nr:ATP-binding protein [Slackia sp.]
MELILDGLDKTETGLLITVDEVNGSLDEMIRLATVYQHFVREGRKASLVMAGLPHNVSSLIKDKTVSFLRRAQRETLGRIDDFEVRDALKKTIEENGRTIGGSGLERAVEAVDGFPFMLQLVGYRIWDESIESQAISDDDVERGIAAARSEMESRILGATYNELSDGDIAYVNAMLEDEGDSKTGDVAARLGISTSLAAQYRRRLIDAGVIGGRRRGVVGFDLPYFREFLERRR